MSRELLQRALDALIDVGAPYSVDRSLLLSALQAELAKPEPDCVAWRIPGEPPAKDGFVLVPVEPTEAMIAVIWDVQCEPTCTDTAARECWSAMLEAAKEQK